MERPSPIMLYPLSLLDVQDALETLTNYKDKKTYREVAISSENVVCQSKVPGLDVHNEELRH